MLDDKNSFEIIKPESTTDLSFKSPFQPYDVRNDDRTTVTSVGLEMQRAIMSAGILQPGENIFVPDFFAFILLPLPPNAKPGIEREAIPAVMRTSVEMGSQFAQGMIEAEEKQIKEWEANKTNWRYIDLYSPEPNTPIERLFQEHHVDYSKGEGLRFLAYGGRSVNRSVPAPKLQAGTK
ncbi:hypothetical protein M1328_01040 [Patescibacteria group bacterium]|nr:hypothetical protein [Patescibacteria group bacterium]